ANVKYDAYGIYTNKPGTAAYRAPGAPQGSYASEANLNRCADAIGMDPVEFRLRNMVEAGERRVNDRNPLRRVAFKETLRAVADRRTKMLALAARHLEADRESLEQVYTTNEQGRVVPKIQVNGDSENSVSLAELGQVALRTTGGPLVGTGTFASEPSHPVIAAQIVEVEVEPDTGVLEVKRLVGSLDVGCAVNPLEVEGQMEGGAVQGLAWGWVEEMQF